MDQQPATPGRPDRRALRDQVFDTILDLLLRGDLQPGARLSIDTIARDLEVSPTPVREALVQMERTGLVVRQALKGYRVAPPLPPEQVAELFEARMIVEVGAAALAEAHCDELVAELREAHQVHIAAAAALAEVSQGQYPLPLLHAYFEADWAFHQVIHRQSANRFLEQMASSLGTQNHRMRQTLQRGGDADLAIEEHSKIIKAYESSVPGAGEQAMKAHLTAVRDRAVKDA